MKTRYLLFVCLLCGFLFYSGKLAFPLAIAVGDDLGYTQRNQGEDTCPKIKITPPMGACDRIPTRNHAHDEAPYIVITAAISFLVGF